MGKTKIAPAISPNKSVEGFVGGVVVATFIGYGTGYFANRFVPEITITASTIIGCITGLLSPLGDLSKSIIKRQFKQKNTSNLIPGHGGLLDRLDTSLWAGPIAFYIITYFFL
jgi:phosphatidate cytidylyltransferase